jgi:hypothetical protein
MYFWIGVFSVFFIFMTWILLQGVPSMLNAALLGSPA